MRLGSRKGFYPDASEAAREKLARIEEQHGRLYAAVVRGEACCSVNDPDYSREWWHEVRVELLEALSK
jgi:hypothetical protein